MWAQCLGLDASNDATLFDAAAAVLSSPSAAIETSLRLAHAPGDDSDFSKLRSVEPLSPEPLSKITSVMTGIDSLEHLLSDDHITGLDGINAAIDASTSIRDDQPEPSTVFFRRRFKSRLAAVAVTMASIAQSGYQGAIPAAHEVFSATATQSPTPEHDWSWSWLGAN